ncbi:MAG: hypothetical protein KC457_33295, partial [Myxococcales bacterium]|nr:hypothetical protein [Myxococcales bacterium]
RGVNLRVAVIGGQAVAAAEIRRPMLRGDGRSTIQALLETLNADPRRGSWRRPALTSLDQIETEDLEARLAASNLSLQQVPAPGQELEISFEELEVIDRSDELHGHWLALAAEAARLLGVDVAGVDLMGPAEELFGSPKGEDGLTRLLEINALPALHLHALPTQGKARPVFEAFVAYCLQMPGAPPVRADVMV